jgi:hypothetical protein
MTLNLTNLKLQFTIYHHHVLIFFFGGWQGGGAEEGFAKKNPLANVLYNYPNEIIIVVENLET